MIDCQLFNWLALSIVSCFWNSRWCFSVQLMMWALAFYKGLIQINWFISKMSCGQLNMNQSSAVRLNQLSIAKTVIFSYSFIFFWNQIIKIYNKLLNLYESMKITNHTNHASNICEANAMPIKHFKTSSFEHKTTIDQASHCTCIDVVTSSSGQEAGPTMSDLSHHHQCSADNSWQHLTALANTWQQLTHVDT